jgi:hypothetical protein
MKASVLEEASANPLIARLETLTTQLGEADAHLAATMVQVAEWRAKAIAASLAARDLEDCLGALVTIDDTDYHAAKVTARHTAYQLDKARTAVIHATTSRDTLAAHHTQARQALQAARHRDRVLAARPELAARLATVQAEVTRARQATGPHAKHEVLQAEHWLTNVEEEITAACRMTSMAG